MTPDPLLGDSGVENVVSMIAYDKDPIAAELWICESCGFPDGEDCERLGEQKVLVQFGRDWLLTKIHQGADA